jgi:hypothetical protein
MDANGSKPEVREEDPFNRPLLIGCTWYAYAMDQRPWGVAQSDLLIGKVPGSLLLAPSIICDADAFEQEQYAMHELGWTSPEVLVKLKEKGVLKVHDFGPSIRSIFEEREAKRALQTLLSSDLTGEKLLKQIRKVDNIISEGLSAEGTCTSHAQARQIFRWKEDPSEETKPFWSGAEQIVLSLFLDGDFYLLPPPNLWPENVKQARAEVVKRQAPHIANLVRLRVDARKYVGIIKDAHGKYDNIIDSFLRSHSAGPYGNYVERLELLLQVRNKLHNSLLVQKMRNEWDKVRQGSMTRLQFEEEFRELIIQETNGLLKAKRDNANDIALNLTFSLTSLGMLQAAFAVGNQSITIPLVQGTIYFGYQLAKAILRRLDLGEDFPMGWINLEKTRKARKFG